MSYGNPNVEDLFSKEEIEKYKAWRDAMERRSIIANIASVVAGHVFSAIHGEALQGYPSEPNKAAEISYVIANELDRLFQRDLPVGDMYLSRDEFERLYSERSNVAPPKHLFVNPEVIDTEFVPSVPVSDFEEKE